MDEKLPPPFTRSTVYQSVMVRDLRGRGNVSAISTPDWS